MKYIPPLFALLAILFVLAMPQRAVQGQGFAEKLSALPQEPDAPLAVTSTPTPLPTDVPVNTTMPTPPPAPDLACLRLNFEMGGDVAQAGTYEVVELGGRPLASWTARAGWVDSGWIRHINISFDAVHVQVFYYASEGAAPVEMKIVNPAPGTSYGWVARGMCHAVEVAWP